MLLIVPLEVPFRACGWEVSFAGADVRHKVIKSKYSTVYSSNQDALIAVIQFWRDISPLAFFIFILLDVEEGPSHHARRFSVSIDHAGAEEIP